jgi:starch-binding outer membrane protein, SusD/RagB family
MKIRILILFSIVSLFVGCKKLLEIPNPENIRPPEMVFAHQSDANEAVAGIYSTWKGLYNNISSPTIIGGLSSDEMENYSLDQNLEQFEKNDISPSNRYLPWSDLYNIIYQSNAVIEGLNNSQSIDTSAKKYYLGEAKFIRAHSYFVLVNFFGDVPLLTTTDVKANQRARRSSADTVYMQIIADLLDAGNLLQSNFFPDTYKYRVNKWVALALVARVYLYEKEWDKAEAMANKVINSGKYSLLNDIDSIMIKDNVEALFQFDDNGSEINIEARSLVFDQNPVIVLTNNFIESFENFDLRRDRWILSEMYQGKRYYYSHKYKSLDFASNERYTICRLAEQYLIRAEARANINKIEDAVSDVNIIRGRVNLPLINSDISLDSCINLIIKERRIEFFAETPHRWFDLKRTKNISSVLSNYKSSWSDSDSLYPLPIDDIKRNSNLKQNFNY